MSEGACWLAQAAVLREGSYVLDFTFCQAIKIVLFQRLILVGWAWMFFMFFVQFLGDVQ